MNIFLEEHQEILKTLLKNKVDFLLIGGYAVIFHGYRRTTGDMDLWLKPDNKNKLKLLEALREAGFEESSLDALNKLDFETHQVFTIGTEPGKIDFITRINTVNYDAADQQKITGTIDGMAIPVIHLNDLVISKFNTGRLKDKADIEELQRISQSGKKI